jgi:endonuclease YncB( thermonuclease family)
MPARNRRLTLAVGFAAAVLMAAAWPSPQGQAPPANSPPRELARAQRGEVSSILDERTLQVTLADGSSRIRLAGVARPHSEPERAAGRDFLERLLTSEHVQVEFLPRPSQAVGDQAPSDPVDAYVFRDPDGFFVNLELIRLGYAPAASKPDHPREDAFRAQEARARAAGKGVWRTPRAKDSPQPPNRPAPVTADATGNAPSAAGETLVYVTPSGSKYHRADCRFAKGTARAITLDEARRRHQPCSVCKPPP